MSRTTLKQLTMKNLLEALAEKKPDRKKIDEALRDMQDAFNQQNIAGNLPPGEKGGKISAAWAAKRQAEEYCFDVRGQGAEYITGRDEAARQLGITMQSMLVRLSQGKGQFSVIRDERLITVTRHKV